MYTKFFGFREKPFKLVPNPEYLFLSKSHEIAMAHLTYAADQGEGFVVISGEVGTGKTTLCRNYLERLDEQTESAYLFNPNLPYEQLLGTICHEFGIATQEIGAKALLERLYTFLIKKNSSEKKVVLVIDEAQSLSIENLELIRMLSNLETTRSKLLQIVLVGQPELEEKLESRELRQLAQRISLSYHLAPLSCDDTQAYIRHRLGIASQQRQSDLFTTDACRLAFRFSKGIPRLINIACDRALLIAYSHNREKVTKPVMHTAIMELTSRGKTNKPHKRWYFYAAAGACLLAIVLGAAVFLGQTDFRFKLDLEGTKPGVSEVAEPESPTAKTFKIPYAENAKRPIVETIPESKHASALPGAEDNTGIPLKTESSASPQPKESSIAALESSSASVFGSSTDLAIPGPDAKIHTQPDQTPIGELINRLEPDSSRKKVVETVLSIWQQPRPNADMIPAGVDDTTFFKIAARQYGLRHYAVQDNWDLIRLLDLPAIVALDKDKSGKPVYLTLVGWHEQKLYFKDSQNGAAIQSDFETVRPYFEGSAYVFWKNVIGYDMIIGYGADSRAISAVKALLGQIGYDQIVLSSEFDSSTRKAVLDFQGRHHLSVDGLVGPLTKIMLLQEAGNIDMPTLSGNHRPQS